PCPGRSTTPPRSWAPPAGSSTDRRRPAPLGPFPPPSTRREKGRCPVIEIPRALARAFRTVLRRSLVDQGRRGPWPPVLCRARPGGRDLEAAQGDVAVRYHQDGDLPAEAFAFPEAVLAECEGRTAAPVALEVLDGGRGRARWADGDGPRVLEFEAVAAE